MILDVLCNLGSSFVKVLMPTRIASCILRILSSACTIFVLKWPHQWVMSILSSPLIITLFPPGPAIFESSDWAHVRVTCGRSPDIARHLRRNSGGEVACVELDMDGTQV
jgi:hypothetical protein